MKLWRNSAELYLTFLGSVERIVFVHIMCDSLVLPALIVMNAGLFINAEQPVLAVCIAKIKYTHRTGLSFSLVGPRGNYFGHATIVLVSAYSWQRSGKL